MTTPYEILPEAGVARVATAEGHFLAEGPVWDPIRGRVLWVDILAGAVLVGRLSYGGGIDVEERIDFPDTAGAVAVAPGGELLVAGTHRLYVRDGDGVIHPGPEIVAGAERRLNDGKPDPAGRFLVGTKGDGVGEQLLSVRPDGLADVLDADLTLSNGIAWSREGDLLYSVDTLRRLIHVRPYDAETGRAGARQVLVAFEHGYPDGLTVDAEDHLWVAMWGAGCVLRITPAGEALARVSLPAPHVSCPVFAGPDLDTLVVTTAQEGMTEADLARHPLAGRLFTVPLAVGGNPPHHWNPSRSLESATKGIA